MIYNQSNLVSFYDLDASGDLSIKGMLKMINEAAFFNAEELGIGLDKTLETGLVFVVQRIGININQLPTLNQSIHVTTWPGVATRSLFKRYGAIKDEEGNVLVEWETIWVLIDINARKIVRPSQFPLDIPQYGNLNVLATAEKINVNPGIELIGSFEHSVKYSELDLNKHMNNANYGDLITNALMEFDNYQIKSWTNVQFNYVNEAKFNDMIKVSVYMSENDLYVEGKSKDKLIFTAKITT